MAQRILKNNTASPVTISDTGYTVPASGQLVIPPQIYGLFEGSNDVIGYIGDSTLTVNDGTYDLAINEGTRLIQGGFSRPISDGNDQTIKATVSQYGSVNRLRVENLNSTPGALVPALTNKLRYLDMNASNGGIARKTDINESDGWVRIFYNSSANGGLIHGYIVNHETSDNWFLRMVVDGEEIFTNIGISSNDMKTDDIYDIDNSEKDGDYEQIGIHFGEHDKILWGFSALPMRFESSVALYLRRVGDKKQFRAGLMVISIN